jgi:hypothetical protein
VVQLGHRRLHGGEMIRIILIAWSVLSIPTAFGLYQLCRVCGQSSTSEPEEKRGEQ